MCHWLTTHGSAGNLFGFGLPLARTLLSTGRKSGVLYLLSQRLGLPKVGMFGDFVCKTYANWIWYYASFKITKKGFGYYRIYVLVSVPCYYYYHDKNFYLRTEMMLKIAGRRLRNRILQIVGKAGKPTAKVNRHTRNNLMMRYPLPTVTVIDRLATENSERINDHVVGHIV